MYRGKRVLEKMRQYVTEGGVIYIYDLTKKQWYNMYAVTKVPDEIVAQIIAEKKEVDAVIESLKGSGVAVKEV